MSINENLDVVFLNNADIKFYHNENGFIILKLKNENKGRVNLKRCYPFSLPDEYICVLDTDDNEIGIIRNLNDLEKTSCECAKKELTLRYYSPEIETLLSVKDKMGHFYFDVMTGGKKKSFTVRDITRNIRFINNDDLIIFDMDGNRYSLKSFSKADKKTQKLLEPYLY